MTQAQFSAKLGKIIEKMIKTFAGHRWSNSPFAGTRAPVDTGIPPLDLRIDSDPVASHAASIRPTCATPFDNIMLYRKGLIGCAPAH